MIRVGYRGYEEGNINENPNFEIYIQGPQQAGVDVGVFFFSQAVTTEELEEEITFMLARLKQYDIKYPVEISLTKYSEDDNLTFRAGALSDEEYVKLLKYFCLRIQEEGYTPIVYFGSEEEYEKICANKMSGFLLWLTEMNGNLRNPHNVLIWQYRNYIWVPGIEKRVGCSSCGLHSLVIQKKEQTQWKDF